MRLGVPKFIHRTRFLSVIIVMNSQNLKMWGMYLHIYIYVYLYVYVYIYLYLHMKHYRHIWSPLPIYWVYMFLVEIWIYLIANEVNHYLSDLFFNFLGCDFLFTYNLPTQNSVSFFDLWLLAAKPLSVICTANAISLSVLLFPLYFWCLLFVLKFCILI